MNLKEVGITQIKLTSKGSTKELDALQTEFNDEVFFFYFLNINPLARNYLLQKIVDLGERAKNLNWPLAKGKRRDEFVEALRDSYRKLVNYYSGDCDDNAVCKMLVATFIKAKKEGMCNDTFYLNWLYKLNKIHGIYKFNDSLKSVYLEILDYFKKKVS